MNSQYTTYTCMWYMTTHRSYIKIKHACQKCTRLCNELNTGSTHGVYIIQKLDIHISCALHIGNYNKNLYCQN